MKFDDRLTDVVYFAEYLKQRYPEVFYSAKTNLEANGIKVKTIPQTKNIWCRDYLPLQVNNHFIKFHYKTVGYDAYPHLHVKDNLWSTFAVPTYLSNLILDGGGVVRNQERVIITEKVFRDNPALSMGKIIKELETRLEAHVVIIPIEPGDSLGHADGICKFVDEKTILINDYSSIFEKDKRLIKYNKKIRSIFEREGLDVETLPYAYGEWDWEMSEKEFRKRFPEADDFNPGFGYYINFLIVRGVILVPVMGIKCDVKVIRTLNRLYPDFNIIAIDCSALSMEGGLLNCVSWNIIGG